MDTRVTVVIPCYNGEKFVADCLTSLQNQTFSQWSSILVDDASRDASVRRAQAIAATDDRMTVAPLATNGGAAAARNFGAQRARGDYLLFLDVDDALEPEMLADTVTYLDSHPDVAAVYTGHKYMDETGNGLGVEAGTWPWLRYAATRFGIRALPPEVPETPFCSIYLAAAVIPSLTVMRKSAFDASGGWDEAFGQQCEDTDLFLRLALRGKIHYINAPLTRYRIHPGQDSSKGRFQQQYNRLFAKWRDLADTLPPDQAMTVREAEWFRTHRFIPLRNLAAAASCARRREWKRGLGLFLAALTGYSGRRPPASTLAPV